MAVGSEKRKSAENLRPTCVPDVLDPYVGAGSEKQPLDRDEEKADDVWRKRHTYEEHRERLSAGESNQ